VIPVKVKLMKLVFMVGEGLVGSNSTVISAVPVVRLPDWFIADAARVSHSNGSLIFSFVRQTSGIWIGWLMMDRMSVDKVPVLLQSDQNQPAIN
jgi:hypothetical protein